ncbi:hypothetical protein PCG10_004422 [Penicillium crustosum]|uniref:Uncharacterized protein n=1 Tax=Penicillium crustosum TaxID=36656 RepID=A0A9P5L5W2_PENCR|nr:hypothetical protein PCG10_004422 [Penicillium crustosum]
MDFLVKHLLTEALLGGKGRRKAVKRWENIDQKGGPVETSGLAESELAKLKEFGFSFGRHPFAENQGKGHTLSKLRDDIRAIVAHGEQILHKAPTLELMEFSVRFEGSGVEKDSLDPMQSLPVVVIRL